MDTARAQRFTEYRKSIYASINGTKGSLARLRGSSMLSKGEKEKLDRMIAALEDLRAEFYSNRGGQKRTDKNDTI